MQLANTYQHIYLSPHYDDASLSCGGTIHKQVQAGQSALVVTICAAAPPPREPLSPFAQSLHQQWGSPEDVVATRRAEDEGSMALLGVDSLRLHIPDCIYRGQPQRALWYYNNNTELFGQIHGDEAALCDGIVETIEGTFSRDNQTRLYAPLTVGHHVDHQLVHSAALRLREQGWEVAFYEDYPYVDPGLRLQGQDRSYDLQATLAHLKDAHSLKLLPQLRFFSEDDLQAKIESIAAYSSQLQILFGGRAKMEAQVRSYALSTGQGSPAERIWQPG